MTKKEYLENKRLERAAAYKKKVYPYYVNPASQMLEPFQISDNLYYVGDKRVCIHMIDTGDGLILLDSGYPCAKHMVFDSIWRCGFDPKNVRWIIHTHLHYDHFGASEDFRNMFGTKLAISRVDAQMLREYPVRAHLGKDHPLMDVPTFDYELEDGEIFQLGNVKLRCVLSPGHTPGVMSFFFETTYEGKTYIAGTFGGVGTNAMLLGDLLYSRYPENHPQVMLRTIEKLRGEHVDIHLGNHPYNSWTVEKREKQLAEGGNPFIDPTSWHRLLDELEEKVHNIIRQNDQFREEIADLPDE